MNNEITVIKIAYNEIVHSADYFIGEIFYKLHGNELSYYDSRSYPEIFPKWDKVPKLTQNKKQELKFRF
jgi:hypothetical protein